MEAVHPPGAVVNRASGCHERLGCDLPPVGAQGRPGVAPAGEDVAIDLMEVHAVGEMLLEGVLTHPVIIPHPTFRSGATAVPVSPAGRRRCGP